MEYKKINIKTAEKMFNKGEKFLIIPNKTNPLNIWGIGLLTDTDQKEKGTFNQLVNNFNYYNCNDRQTGLKPAFYRLIDWGFWKDE
jgi:hypothetical protein